MSRFDSCGVLIALALTLVSCRPRNGAVVPGVTDIDSGSEVIFLPGVADSQPIRLSDSLAERFVELVRDNAVYRDERGMTAESYGTFSVGSHAFHLHYTFLCDDLHLRGRFWDSGWIGAALKAKTETVGFYGSQSEWREFFEELAMTSNDLPNQSVEATADPPRR